MGLFYEDKDYLSMRCWESGFVPFSQLPQVGEYCRDESIVLW